MEILGIGPMELFFILIIAIVVLGPKDMVKAGRTLGRFMRDVVKSDYYRALVSSSREIKDLPTRLIREANLEDDLKEVDQLMRTTGRDMTANTIHPPRKSAGPRAQVAEEESPAVAPDAGADSTGAGQEGLRASPSETGGDTPPKPSHS
jgi:Sec-independent protein translocase protein TatA